MSRRSDFEEAAKAAYPMLFRAAVVLTGSRADAEDAVQETLLAALKAWGGFRKDASPATWMYRILVREAGRVRRRARAMDSGREGRIEIAAEETQVCEQYDEYRRVLEHLAGLPERQKEIVTLFYLESLSYQETADALSVSIGTVKSALSRARATLREKLKRHQQPEVTDGLPK